jgi:uncharacterized protein YbjT (DUF2867 family)
VSEIFSIAGVPFQTIGYAIERFGYGSSHRRAVEFSDMTNTTNNTILVIGSTGKTGKRVADQLQARGIPVRHGFRSAEIPFDWDNPQTWAPALAGVEHAYVSYYPHLAALGSVDAIRELTRLAKQAGVHRLVLLSTRGEDEALEAEEVVRSSGLEWTIVRASWFTQNFSEGDWLDDVRSGTVALPIGDVREPFIDADDIAQVAAAALTDDRHVGQTYEVTGPRLVSFADAVADISAATGRDVKFVTVSMDEYFVTLADYGLPQEVIPMLRKLYTYTFDGRNARLADGVQRALGRQPKDFADYARETAATGVWTP